MSLTREDIEILDRSLKGELTSEEVERLNDRMKTDENFRNEAERHFILVKELKRHDNRRHLRSIFNEAHAEVSLPAKTISSRNTWAFAAIAASIAIVSVVTTFFVTRSWNSEQTSMYLDLSRKVDRINKSQNIILKDIQQEKNKKAPGTFAGTGFLISPGYISTSYHVVKVADSIYIENEKFGSIKTSIVYTDVTNDVAILKIENENDLIITPPYTISSKEGSLAEEVFTLGYPREDVVFGAGNISAVTGYKGNPNAYQVSVPVNPGNSGGPLFNNKGDLIGIISGKQTETSGVAFATKSTILLGLLSEQSPDSIRQSITKFRMTTQSTSSRVQQVKQWHDYVFMVKVFKN
ncbi:MAG: serine protease [Bacteroidota bacterium]